MLSDRQWRLQYTPDDGNLVKLFYVPALEDATRYDRLTGYFSAGALALATRGIDGLVRNDGVMRMVVGCTLKQDEIEAIARGERLRNAVRRRLADLPLAPDPEGQDALELLAWMVARGHLEVKVAVPCDADRNPVADEAIFHEKTGVVEDRTGERIAWIGSLNETTAGWTRNWERIHVYTSWRDPERVAHTKAAFDALWNDQARRVIVLGLPDAVRRDLLRFLPKDGRPPARLEAYDQPSAPPAAVREPPPPPYRKDAPDEHAFRDRVWSFVKRAPAMGGGGKRVGEATSAVEPWPHQVRAFDRMYDGWPPRLLVADEVGLGKTIQAGMLLRQAWLSGRAKRILVLAPKVVLRQWQIELHEKFNLNWPVYDQGQLAWHPSPAWRGNNARPVDAHRWHEEPVVIASSHLVRRTDRRQALLEDAAPWDLIVLDEAHHARHRAAGSATDNRPNSLLRLLQGLKDRTEGLVLLTATPLQVDPVELWDLLDLLGLLPEWTPSAFKEFFESASRADPTPDAFERMAQLFQATERRYGKTSGDEVAQALKALSRLRTRRVVRDLRDNAATPRCRMDGEARQAALRLLRVSTPVRRLVSRHTRELLREYHRRGLLRARIADRHVDDRFVEMTAGERALYEAVEDYIATTYNQASEDVRRAVKRRFRDGDADVLLCTEAAAEGLNFQFCGALVNYDMPWNPMRVEQRIGRIDRVGQLHPTIHIVNLHYEDTVETDIYRVLRERIGLFTKMVGRLQPILSRLPGQITRAVLTGQGKDAAGRLQTVAAMKAEAQEADGGFDIDAALDDVLDPTVRPEPLVTMDDLDRVIGQPGLLPPGTKVQPLGNREYGVTPPGATDPVRVTTDPDHYREHSDSVELWSPGNRLFQRPKPAAGRPPRAEPPGTTLKDILDG